MSPLAELLASRQRELVDRWLRAVAARVALGSEVTPAELRDHVPDFLRELIAVVERGKFVAEAAGAESAIAREHGGQRFRIGFDIDALVSEYAVLRGCILELIEEMGCPVAIAEVRALTDFISASVAAGVREHTCRQRSSQREAAEIFRRREAWSSTTLQSIGDAVIATDPDGLITFMNPPAEKLTGWQQRDAAGTALAQVFRIFHEETRAPLESPVDRVLREGHVVGLGNHTLLLRRDGSEIPIDDSAAPIRNEAGELSGVVLVFRDVTDKRRAEEAIADLLKREKAVRAEAEIERQKLYSVFMQAPVAICILEGPQHTFVFATPAYRALVGDRDVVGKPLLEALPDIRGQGFDQLLDQVVATGEPFFGGEIPAKLAHHGPGESLIMNFFYSPKRNVAGRIDGVLVSVIDVTDQVRARERLQALADQLRDSEERLRRVVDASGTGTWEVDLCSDRMTGDAQHLALMGLPPSTTLTRNISLEATHPDDHTLLAHAFTAAVAGENGGRFFIEHRVAGSDPAGWRWVEGRGQLLVSSDGTPGRLVGTTVDVTERKRTERALADERDKLQTIFQESPAAMALWRGPELVFEKVNPEYQAIFGDRELMGKPLAEAIPSWPGSPSARSCFTFCRRASRWLDARCWPAWRRAATVRSRITSSTSPTCASTTPTADPTASTTTRWT